MAQTVRFYAGPSYSAQDHIDVWRRHMRDTGVVSTAENAKLLVSVGSGMQVSVGTGEAFLDGYWYENSAAETLSVGASDPSNWRLDRIIVRNDLSAGTATAQVLAGSAHASPSLQALTRSATVYDIGLAYVAVPAGAVSLSAGNVIDTRFDPSVAGLINNRKVVANSTPGTGNPGSLWIDTSTSPGKLKFEDDDNTFVAAGPTTDTRTAWFDAGSAILQTAGISGFFAPERTPVDGSNIAWYELRFDATANEYAFFPGFVIPPNWNGAAITFTIWWKCTATTGNVIWHLTSTSIPDNGAWDGSVSDVGQVTDAAKGSADLANQAVISGIPTGAAAGEVLRFGVYREANSGSDTLSGDAKILGIQVAVGITL